MLLGCDDLLVNPVNSLVLECAQGLQGCIGHLQNTLSLTSADHTYPRQP
jgi:hypothetical protein